jgi:anthranilate phosphoribosyltransferase
VLVKFIENLTNSRDLTTEQVRFSVEQLIQEGVSAQQKADFLCSLALKGETVEEIAGFAQALREKSVEPPFDPLWRQSHGILDVCGTGGDRLNTFNISTTVALICAAAGVPVAKHGNRAITSQCGSADVLEALNIRVDLPPADAARSLQERNFAFFFAPNYHPAFKHIAAARRLCSDRGQRTIFNFLGPLLNPARPSAQLVGVPRPDLCSPLARVLQSLGIRRGMVVSGEVTETSRAGTANSNPEPAKPKAYLDELSTVGPNRIAEFYQGDGCLESTLDISQFRLQNASLEDLAGGNREANAIIVRRIVSGQERGPKRDAVLLNAAAALTVADRAPTLAAGWQLAEEAIDNGRVEAKLRELAE